MIAECWKSSSVLLNGGAEELFSILGNFCGKGLEGEIKIDLSGFCDSLPLFQFTHLHEVRPIFQSGDCKLFEFQFTHLHEVRRFALFCAMSDDTFQFTHLHEVRPRFFISQRLFKNFNSRTYTRCDSPPSPITSRMPNFNSRTYTRCD